MKEFEKYIGKNKNLIICINNNKRSFDIKNVENYKNISIIYIQNINDYENLLHGREGDLFIDININKDVKKLIKMCFR